MAEVLMLTDDPRIKEMLRVILEEEEHQVIAVEETEHALIQLRATLHPVVALLLGNIPLGLTLAELLTTLHAEREDLAPHAYIAITHYPQHLSDEIPQVLSELDVLVIVPPYDVEKLLAEVSRLAGRFPARWR